MNLFENLQLLHENQDNIELFINTPIEELVDGKLITDIFNEYSNDYKVILFISILYKTNKDRCNK